MRNSRAGVTLGRPCWAPGEKHPRLPVYCDREHTDTHPYERGRIKKWEKILVRQLVCRRKKIKGKKAIIG